MNSLAGNYNNFNIADAFKQTFGMSAPVNYKVPDNKPVEQKQADYGFQIPARAQQQPNTQTGSPIRATDAFGRDYYLPIKLGGNYLYFPVMTIDQVKRIIETPMTEQRGDVNEIISNGDVIINIRGIIYRPDNIFPEDEIALLQNAYMQKQSLTIQNAVTDIVLQNDGGELTNTVIIKHFRLLPAQGKSIGYRPYELELKSDFVQTLEIVEEDEF